MPKNVGNEKSTKFIQNQLNKLSAEDEPIKWLFWLICCAASSQKVENKRIKDLIDVKNKHFSRFDVGLFNSEITHEVVFETADGNKKVQTINVIPDRAKHRLNLKEFIFDRSSFNRHEFNRNAKLGGYPLSYKWDNLTSADGIGFQAIKVMFCASASINEGGLKEHVIRFLKEFPNDHHHWTQGVPEITALINQYLESDDEEAEDQPYLLLEKETGYSKLHYNHAILKVFGRNEQEKRLERFLNFDKPVAWFQLAGEAGQGKSRLAFDLAFKAKDNMGWNAGFVVDESIQYLKHNIETWLPNRPTLLIFDYVIGQTDDVKLVLRTLSRRKDDFKESPIRILLLERQAWSGDKFYNVKNRPHEESGLLGLTIGDEQAYWYKQLCDENSRSRKDSVIEKIRFNDGVCHGVEILGKLDRESIITIIRKIAEKERGDNSLTLSDDEIFETLEKIDESKRPLLAYLLGVQLAHDPEGYKCWTHIDILNKTLAREKNNRWINGFDRIFPAYRDDDLSLQIAVLATIIRELDYDSGVIIEHFGKLNSTTIKEAAIITSGTLIKENEDLPKTIKALEPDLLGEWFVLNAFDQGMEFEPLIDFAWKNFERKTTEFLDRVTRDFIILPENQCEDPELTKRILAHILNQSDTDSLYSACQQLVFQHYQDRSSIPQFLINTISHAAKNKEDSLIMRFLGTMYFVADCPESDAVNGIDWFEQAASLGDKDSMFLLGLCYEMGGEDIAQSWGKAIEYYELAAEVGHSGAMLALGRCYLNGDGVVQDWARAIRHFEQAADLSDSDAMLLLGTCYQNGKGAAQDCSKAIAYFEQAADLGNSSAMFNLGRCYLNGDGVVQDWAKAFAYFEQAADLGNSSAMLNLGLFYRGGHGVAKDLGKAIEYFEQASAEGDERADQELRSCLMLQYFLLCTENSVTKIDAQLISIEVDSNRPVTNFDRPLIAGDWINLSSSLFMKTLPLINDQLKFYADGIFPEETVALRSRQMPLTFYLGYNLTEIQCYLPRINEIKIITAITGKKSALLLNGEPSFIHDIGAYVLSLKADNVIAYTCFYCSYVRGEGGAFQIITSCDDIPFENEADKKLLGSIKSKIFHPKVVDDTLSQMGYQRIEACVLYGNNLFSAIFIVHKDGQVEVEDDKSIAYDLPIYQRQYRGIFRTQLET